MRRLRRAADGRLSEHFADFSRHSRLPLRCRAASPPPMHAASRAAITPFIALRMAAMPIARGRLH